MGADIGGLIFFSAMREYIKHQLESYLADGLNRVISFVGVIALTMLTLWIMIEGYRIMTGQSRTPLVAFIVNAGKAVMIVTIATSGALYNDWVVDTIDDFRDEVTYLITGTDQDVYRQVDNNLALTQTMLSTVSTLAKRDNATDAEAKKAWWIGAFGGAGPAVVGGMVSLLNEIMLHFAIMLGPLFILGLLFEQTKQLFWSWVKSVLGLMLSMGVLAFLSGLVMKITIGYATAAVAAIAVNNWLPGVAGLLDMPSITDTMMVQGGIGLLLTTLLITIPPAVSQFVGGTLGGGVSGFSPWGSAGGGNPAKGQNTQQQAPSSGKAGEEDVGSPQSQSLPNPGGPGARVTPPGGDQVPGAAPVSTDPPNIQLQDVNAQLANKGYGVSPGGNIYQTGPNNARQAYLADHGQGPAAATIPADVKALADRNLALQQDIKASQQNR